MTIVLVNRDRRARWRATAGTRPAAPPPAMRDGREGSMPLERGPATLPRLHTVLSAAWRAVAGCGR
ncbi:MAG: hypothetical protein ACRDRI_05330 [Pseudonocardiaceae bacterium]